jgi:hypothetical protein
MLCPNKYEFYLPRLCEQQPLSLLHGWNLVHFYINFNIQQQVWGYF